MSKEQSGESTHPWLKNAKEPVRIQQMMLLLPKLIDELEEDAKQIRDEPAEGGTTITLKLAVDGIER